MKRSTLLLLFALISSCAICVGQKTLRTSSADAARGERGKEIFVSHGCARCHDEDGNKKLTDGTTLIQRLSKSTDPEARLQTRLQDRQERHAVMMHLQETIKRLQSSTHSR
ncbi:MAG: hypothetical protein DMG64_05890 [Acidobacteria bacterium]|nr:MAG: hypothetical protein DMG64_05890 [Acidobacteriota bacterium]PYY21835.1 MAG: hypothetical protein DMG62_16925 [Acidobacteriota bacterium]